MIRTLSLLALLAACSSSSPFPTGQGDRQMTFNAPRDDVYHGVIYALERQGYEIMVANPNSLEIEGQQQERRAIVRCQDKGGRIVVRLGISHGAKTLEYRRIQEGIEKYLARKSKS